MQRPHRVRALLGLLDTDPSALACCRSELAGLAIPLYSAESREVKDTMADPPARTRPGEILALDAMIFVWASQKMGHRDVASSR